MKPWRSHAGKPWRSHAGPHEFIVLMGVLMATGALAIDTMLPALGQMGLDLGVSYANQAQYILSTVFIGMGLGQLIGGPLADALGRKPVLYVGLGIFLVGTLVCLAAASLEQMLLGRLIQGLGVSAPSVVTMAIIRDRYSGRAMARVLSLAMTIFIMVPVFAPALGQGLLLLFSWRSIFVLYLAYALLVSCWVFLRLEETLSPSASIPFRLVNIWQGTRKVFGNRITLGYGLCLGCVMGALLGDLTTIQQIYQGQFGVGKLMAVYFGGQALAFAVTSFCNSRLVERYGMRRLCLYAIGTMVVASLVVGLVSLLQPVTLWLYFGYGVVLLFCLGMSYGNLNALAMEPMGELAGLAASLISSLSLLLGMGLGTIIGQLYDGSVTPVVLGFTLLGSIAWLIIFAERSGAGGHGDAALTDPAQADSNLLQARPDL